MSGRKAMAFSAWRATLPVVHCTTRSGRSVMALPRFVRREEPLDEHLRLDVTGADTERALKVEDSRQARRQDEQREWGHLLEVDAVALEDAAERIGLQLPEVLGVRRNLFLDSRPVVGERHELHHQRGAGR